MAGNITVENEKLGIWVEILIGLLGLWTTVYMI